MRLGLALNDRGLDGHGRIWLIATKVVRRGRPWAASGLRSEDLFAYLQLFYCHRHNRYPTMQTGHFAYQNAAQTETCRNFRSVQRAAGAVGRQQTSIKSRDVCGGRHIFRCVRGRDYHRPDASFQPNATGRERRICDDNAIDLHRQCRGCDRGFTGAAHPWIGRRRCRPRPRVGPVQSAATAGAGFEQPPATVSTGCKCSRSQSTGIACGIRQVCLRD